MKIEKYRSEKFHKKEITNKKALYFEIGQLKLRKSHISLNSRDKLEISRVKKEETRRLKKQEEELKEFDEKKLKYNDYTAQQLKLRFKHLQKKELTAYEIKLKAIIKDLYHFLLKKKFYGHYFKTAILEDNKLYLNDINKYFKIEYYRRENQVLLQIEDITGIEKLLND